MSTFKGIRGNDQVTYRDRFDRSHTGRAQLLLVFSTHVVLNGGGPHGTPVVVNESNYISHTRPADNENS